MLKNYLKIALRNYLKNKILSTINLIGLTIGLAVVIVIAVFINHELSYDNFHNNGDQLYRVIIGNADDIDSNAGTPGPLGPFLKTNIPEIADYARRHKTEMVVGYKNKKFSEKEFYFADPSFFKMFSFPLIKGDAGSALNAPNSIVITETVSKKYFGANNPVGKILSLDGGLDFTITAVAKDVPENSHLNFEFIIPFEQLDEVMNTNYHKTWGNWSYFTYILTGENTDKELLKNKVKKLFNNTMQNNPDVPTDLTYQPIKDIHFQFNRMNIKPAFNDKYLTIFLSIAIAVLIIACINFINLTTARSMKRAKEVGLRKTFGAENKELVWQFLSESTLLSVIAGIFAVIIVQFTLPFINTMAGKNYSINYTDVSGYLLFGGLILFTGLFAGTYPAVILSSFNPVKALKGNMIRKTKTSFRNTLVVFQFAVSIVLIICSIIISQQIKFIRTSKLGFVTEQIINIPLTSSNLALKAQTIKEELRKNSNVINASVNSYQPSNFQVFWGGLRWEGMTEKDAQNSMWIINSDRDFVKTYQIKMLEGEDYLANYVDKNEGVFVLNKSALKMLNWETAVGKEITYWGSFKGKIVGVMDDFHFRSLHHSVEPCALFIKDMGTAISTHISVRIKTEDVTSCLASLGNTWDSFKTNLPFDYYFLDDDFAKLYESETRISSVLESFTLVALFIACIGLFGLTTFIVEQRKKELGIRKVLGASSIKLWKEFSFNFTKWVIISNLIAWPLAYYFMDKWLQDFAYRTELSWWIFALSGGIALLIALATVSFQAIKAASANPIESLRYE